MGRKPGLSVDSSSTVDGSSMLLRESQAWLTGVLGRITDHKINRIDDLLPWCYALTDA